MSHHLPNHRGEWRKVNAAHMQTERTPGVNSTAAINSAPDLRRCQAAMQPFAG
jgi:hypothetical protein